jgi:hypothetical protein
MRGTGRSEDVNGCGAIVIIAHEDDEIGDSCATTFKG